jgi:O-acetyl-ADP-ribose deacetylase (regulator of RNase III)
VGAGGGRVLSACVAVPWAVLPAARALAVELTPIIMTSVKARYALPDGASLCISQGNIVAFSGDAIVNAADTKCIYGKGVDGAINKAGGPGLIAARKALPVVAGTDVRCPVGAAVATSAGNGSLRVTWVIHAVGPNFNPKAKWVQRLAPNGEELLYSAYTASMQRAREKGCATICFSLLSAGFFRGPKPLHDVLCIACRAILAASYPGLRECHLLAFGEPNRPATNDVRTLKQAASDAGLTALDGSGIGDKGSGGDAMAGGSSSSSSVGSKDGSVGGGIRGFFSKGEGCLAGGGSASHNQLPSTAAAAANRPIVIDDDDDGELPDSALLAIPMPQPSSGAATSATVSSVSVVPGSSGSRSSAGRGATVDAAGVIILSGDDTDEDEPPAKMARGVHTTESRERLAGATRDGEAAS